MLDQLLDAPHDQTAIGQLLLVPLQLRFFLVLQLLLHLGCSNLQRCLHAFLQEAALLEAELLLRPQNLPAALLLPHNFQPTQLLALKVHCPPDFQFSLGNATLTIIRSESCLHCW